MKSPNKFVRAIAKTGALLGSVATVVYFGAPKLMDMEYDYDSEIGFVIYALGPERGSVLPKAEYDQRKEAAIRKYESIQNFWEKKIGSVPTSKLVIIEGTETRVNMYGKDQHFGRKTYSNRWDAYYSSRDDSVVITSATISHPAIEGALSGEVTDEDMINIIFAHEIGHGLQNKFSNTSSYPTELEADCLAGRVLKSIAPQTATRVAAGNFFKGNIDAGYGSDRDRQAAFLKGAAGDTCGMAVLTQ